MASQSIVFFDGTCNLCNGYIQFILKHESTSHYQFASLQSPFAIAFFANKHFDTSQIDSVIVFENEQFYTQSEAVFKIIQHLKWPYKSASIFSVLPLFLSNFMYKLMAKYRYKLFGQAKTCWVMQPQYINRFLN